MIWHCPVCNLVANVTEFPVQCACGLTQYNDPPGIGDKVAVAIARAGITPEKLEAWTKRPCGCKKRQQWLNRLGDKISQ